MRYIVDGYNVINSSDKFSASSLKKRREKLVEFIWFCRTHRNFRNFVTVVFDSKSKNLYESYNHNKFYVNDIEIIFSEGVLSADDIIAQLADESKNPQEVTIVTNDKGLRRRTSACGAKHETVEAFLLKGFKTKNIKSSKGYFDKGEKDFEDIINKEFKKLWLEK